MNGPDNNDNGDDEDEDDNGNDDEEEGNDEAIGREDGDPTGLDFEQKATSSSSFSSSSSSSSSSSRMGISSSGTSCKGVLPNIMRLRQICDFTVAISNGNEGVMEPSAYGNINTNNNTGGSSNCSASSSSSSNANHTIETGNVLSPCVPYALVMYVLKYSVLFLAT